jgi:hypothetical protein
VPLHLAKALDGVSPIDYGTTPPGEASVVPVPDPDRT